MIEDRHYETGADKQPRDPEQLEAPQENQPVAPASYLAWKRLVDCRQGLLAIKLQMSQEGITEEAHAAFALLMDEAMELADAHYVNAETQHYMDYMIDSARKSGGM